MTAATFLSVLMIVACALGTFAERETVGPLLLKAGRDGYGGLPVVGLHTVERTAEFYAAGRLAYDGQGEPLKLEGSEEVAEFARRSGGRVLHGKPSLLRSWQRADVVAPAVRMPYAVGRRGDSREIAPGPWSVRSRRAVCLISFKVAVRWRSRRVGTAAVVMADLP